MNARGRPRSLALVAATLAACAVPATVLAHKASDAYLDISARNDRVQVRWDIALRDLDAALDLDADRDGRLTWGEVRARHADTAAFALRALGLSTSAGECVHEATTQSLRRRVDGTYAVLAFESRCPSQADPLTLRYRLFESVDPSHRGIVRLGGDATDGGDATGGVAAAVVPPDGTAIELRPSSAGTTASGFGSFVWLGVEHVLAGWDHLAFLFALLLPAVLRRTEGRWVPATHAGASARSVVAIVTAFTLAHSITLALAVVGGLSPPASIVEPAIAASVVLAALHNLWPLSGARQWQIAFGFGLVHGFGFAGALQELGLERGSLAASLLGFNLGVELGQLAAVAVVLPICWFARRHRFYRGAALPALSLALTAFGLLWLVERLFDLKILPT